MGKKEVKPAIHRSRFITFMFPRKNPSDGSPVLKQGKVRCDAIDAIEPGTGDGMMHLHLSGGAHLVVQEQAEVEI